MATVARMPATNTSTESNRKPPASCAAESAMFHDNRIESSSSNNTHRMNVWQGEEPNRMLHDGAGSGSG
eukprot:CAMPEP_0117078374 /NCGR_PEP_ID=MMETSP0472-20121206/55260_1 /TAXON_ID=693140 ORGANISM="Tiarina fusus, Strain LIS" /NCGR_SAMPLE_ID=MMETSP0472 /ASSEMBLY_ACC=CAM_ASM_000603 /LENGTH=68 /DNA_ID=CAMNT_0004805091 /DNA_START=31 /DNA_END=234 /DNA_ORIENTATION=-